MDMFHHQVWSAHQNPKVGYSGYYRLSSVDSPVNVISLVQIR